MISLSDLTIPQLYTPSAGFEPASSSSLERRIIRIMLQGGKSEGLAFSTLIDARRNEI